MEDKEKLRGLIESMAEEFDTLADEYEQRISDYEEALNSVNEALAELEDEEETESPDSGMSDFLMEQDELQDNLENAFPEGLRGGIQADEENIRSAIESVSNLQDIRDRLEDSMDSSANSGLKDTLSACRNILETALVENKADYARLLRNIELLGRFWEFTE